MSCKRRCSKTVWVRKLYFIFMVSISSVMTGLLFKILQNFHRFKKVRFYILFPFSLCTIFTPARYILLRYTFLKTRFYWRIDQKWTWPNTTQKKCLFITTHTLHLLHSHMQICTSSMYVQALSSRWISIWTAVCSVVEFPFCYSNLHQIKSKG